MVKQDNIIYLDDKEAFFLIHLDPDEEKELMDSLKDLGIEAEAEVVYCG